MSLQIVNPQTWSLPTTGTYKGVRNFGAVDESFETNIRQFYKILSVIHHTQKLFADDLTSFSLDVGKGFLSINEVQKNFINDPFLSIVESKIYDNLFNNTDLFTSKVSELILKTTEYEAFQVSVSTQNEKTFEGDVINDFKTIHEVKEIYTQYYRSEKIFIIFIASAKYNDELMNTLLDKEINILDKYPNRSLSFKYIPFISFDESKVYISQDAVELYRG